MKTEERIIAVVKRVALKENRELQLMHHKGLLYLPEIALSYLVAKEFGNCLDEVFGADNKYTWNREQKMHGQPGPVDLVLKPEDGSGLPSYAIELKMDCTNEKTAADITKLHNIVNNPENGTVIGMTIGFKWLNKESEVDKWAKEVDGFSKNKGNYLPQDGVIIYPSEDNKDVLIKMHCWEIKATPTL